MLVRELFEDAEDFVQRWMKKHANVVSQIQSDLATKRISDDPEFEARIDALPPGVMDRIWSGVAAAINKDTEDFVRTRDQEEARNRANKPRPTLRRVK
jgi:hypothetical protein